MSTKGVAHDVGGSPLGFQSKGSGRRSNSSMLNVTGLSNAHALSFLFCFFCLSARRARRDLMTLLTLSEEGNQKTSCESSSIFQKSRRCKTNARLRFSGFYNLHGCSHQIALLHCTVYPQSLTLIRDHRFSCDSMLPLSCTSMYPLKNLSQYTDSPHLLLVAST